MQSMCRPRPNAFSEQIASSGHEVGPFLHLGRCWGAQKLHALASRAWVSGGRLPHAKRGGQQAVSDPPTLQGRELASEMGSNILRGILTFSLPRSGRSMSASRRYRLTAICITGTCCVRRVVGVLVDPSPRAQLSREHRGGCGRNGVHRRPRIPWHLETDERETRKVLRGFRQVSYAAERGAVCRHRSPRQVIGRRQFDPRGLSF